MKILTIRYSSDLSRAEKFYELLGLKLNADTSSPVWRDMQAGAGSVAIHPKTDDSPEFEFSLETAEKLEEVQARLVSGGFEPGVIDAEEHGRYLLIVDPDGIQLRINEIQEI